VAVSIHDRWQRILRHSSIALTTYVEVIEAVKRDALDSMGSLFGAEPDASAFQPAGTVVI
jgi:hypothetical protein